MYHLQQNLPAIAVLRTARDSNVPHNGLPYRQAHEERKATSISRTLTRPFE